MEDIWHRIFRPNVCGIGIGTPQAFKIDPLSYALETDAFSKFPDGSGETEPPLVRCDKIYVQRIGEVQNFPDKIPVSVAHSAREIVSSRMICLASNDYARKVCNKHPDLRS